MLGAELTLPQIAVRGGVSLNALVTALVAGATAAMYDPSDLTSLYQSRTGILSGNNAVASVGAVVGLMLDKAQMRGLTAAEFIASQPEVLGNGTFSGGTTGWSGANATLSNPSGRLRITNVGGSSSRGQTTVTTVANRWYCISFELAADAATGNTFVNVGTSAGGSQNLSANVQSTLGTYTHFFLATATTTHISLSMSSSSLAGEYIEVDNVSVKEVPGNHALAPSDAARPILRQDAGGKYYIDCDGVDDQLNVLPTLNLGSQWAHVGGWNPEADGDYLFGTTSDFRGAPRTEGANISWYTTSSVRSTLIAGAGSGLNVLTFEKASNSAMSGRRNGADSSTLDPYEDGGTAGLVLFNSDNDSFVAGVDGRFYGGIWKAGALTSAERAVAESWAAQLCGTTLS